MKKQPHNNLTLNIKVEPRSSKSEIVGPYGDGIKVKLTSPPVDGRANKELIELLSNKLKLRKKDIEIISGECSKNKVVSFNGVKELRFQDRSLIYSIHRAKR